MACVSNSKTALIAGWRSCIDGGWCVGGGCYADDRRCHAADSQSLAAGCWPALAGRLRLGLNYYHDKLFLIVSQSTK
eukprot:scaffold466576_cov49-Prasinocladus_malaysianus.AAC.2